MYFCSHILANPYWIKQEFMGNFCLGKHGVHKICINKNLFHWRSHKVMWTDKDKASADLKPLMVDSFLILRKNNNTDQQDKRALQRPGDIEE
jgi:hypothetical protein